MFKVEKNDKAFKELTEYSKSISLSLRETLLSDTHLDKVSAIFYKNMPKMVRMAMKEEKFKEFYKNNREKFAGSIIV